MIAQAITEYAEKTNGRAPLRIELHPTAMRDFLDDLAETSPDLFKKFEDDCKFKGVFVLPSAKAMEPRIITQSGFMEPL